MCEGRPSNSGTLVNKVPAISDGMINETSESAALHTAVRVYPGDVIVRRPRFGVFAATDLDLILRTRGIDTVIVGGSRPTSAGNPPRAMPPIVACAWCFSQAALRWGRGSMILVPSRPAKLRSRMDAFFADVVRSGDLQFDAP